jgi:large repetitive protein
MTSERELDRLLGAFLAIGTDELADRVIDAALDEIDHTGQRRAMRMPRRLQALPLSMRLATAAVVGLLAVGGTFVVFQGGQPGVGGPSPSLGVSTEPSPSAVPPSPSLLPSAEANVALTGPMGVGRQIHTATRLADGGVLIAGGYALGDDPLASATRYDPATDAFRPTGSLAMARGTQTATLLRDGRVLIVGGGPTAWNHPDPFLSSAELYDPTTGTFALADSMSTPREAHTATLLADGRVLIVGGNDANGHALTSAEVFDPTTGTFAATGSMTTARGYFTATRLADGRVLVAGGNPGAWTYNGPMVDSAEIYDPKAGTFSDAGSLAHSRAFHTATLLADGRVLLTGGTNGGGDLQSAEVYDPPTGTFSLTGAMVAARIYHTATLLADGRVLVAGGGSDYANRNFLRSAELFDPRTGTFSRTGSMADTRTYHTATLLADGRVLVTGGYGVQAPLASSEIYDPTTGVFSPAGSGG